MKTISIFTIKLAYCLGYIILPYAYVTELFERIAEAFVLTKWSVAGQWKKFKADYKEHLNNAENM